MNALNRGHNYYNELGIDSSATPDEIKEAYRRLAREFHPDVNQSENARLKFSSVQHAYQILSDAHLRAEYDMQRGILTNEEDFNGYLNSSKKLRDDINFAPDIDTAYYINRHSKKTTTPGLLDRVKALVAEGTGDSSIVGKEYTRRKKAASSPPERERIFTFSIDEIEALTGTTRTIVVNDNGARVRRELAIPPIDQTQKKLKIKLPKLNGKIGYDEVKIIVNVVPNPNFKRSKFDIYLEVPMLRKELNAAISMTVATTEGFETITLEEKNIKTPLILSSGGLWDKDRNLHGDLIIKVIEVDANGDKEKEEEIKTERERILFMLSSLKRKPI